MGVYWCGYNLTVFSTALFGFTQRWTHCTSQDSDILVFGAHGPCKCNPVDFKGRILSVNGEDHAPRKYTRRTMQIGVGGINFPYGAVEWINREMIQYDGPITHYAVAYANSNCVESRERMVMKLAEHVTVHAFGACTGHGKATKIRRPGRWTSNVKLFHGYAMVIAAEHGVSPGYVTEKPFVAAASGAIPIYDGDTELLYRFMNPDRIIVWNSRAIQTVKTHMLSLMRRTQAVNNTFLLMKANEIRTRLMQL